MTADNLTAHLARLPPELLTQIIALCGAETCAILQHLPALQCILARLLHVGHSYDAERAVLDSMLEHKWSRGVQLMMDLGICVPASALCSQWEGILLPAATIKSMWRAANFVSPNHPTIVYNLIEAGEDGVDELLEWCSSRSRRFGIYLGNEVLRRGGSLDQLLALCKQTRLHIGDRFLANQFIVAAAGYGRLDIVRYFDGVAPELAQDRVEPLREAVRGEHIDMMQYLVERTLSRFWRDAVSATLAGGHHDIAERFDEAARVPRQFPVSPWPETAQLLQHGPLDDLQRAWRKGPVWDGKQDRVPPWVTTTAIAGNQVQTLQWLHSIDPRCCLAKYMYPYMPTIDQPTFQWVVKHSLTKCNNKAVTKAFASGRQDLLGWLLDAVPDARTSNFIPLALHRGDLSLAHWLAERLGKPGAVERLKAEAMAWATNDEDWMDLVQYMCNDGHINCRCKPEVLQAAVRRRAIGCASMLLHHHPDMEIDRQVLVYLCRDGDTSMVKWVCQRVDTTTPYPNAMDGAVERGHFETVRWLHQYTRLGCTTAAMDKAAAIWRLDIVQFLHEHRNEGCTTTAMDNAATSGDIDALTWLHENRAEGCSSAAMVGAAGNGLINVIRWLHEHYPHTLTAAAMDAAAGNGWLDVVKFLHTEYSAPCTVNAMNEAAGNGHLDVVRWLHDNRTEGCTDQAMASAADYGHFSVAQFLYEHGYPVVTRRSVWWSDHILEWLGPADDGRGI
ncbi:hypothetical protein RI367_006149 [Sorochytrium milnesiophthora]